MQAIILAAGMGKRLKELTQDVTKCMVKVNGVTLIERMLKELDTLSLSRIVIVVGYQAERLKEYIATLSVHTPIVYVTNEVYDKTNNIYSLYLARNYLMEDNTLLLESDLIFEEGILENLIQNPTPNLALVAKYENWMDGTVVTINDITKEILDFVDKRHFTFENIKNYYKTVNIYKFSKEFSKDYYVPLLESYSQVLGKNEYYEQILRIIILLNRAEILENAIIKAEVLENEAWYEIDDVADLDIAESIFTVSEDDKVAKFQGRYGGYWRYPKLLDFCYLVNPYYPPPQLMNEIKANFERLISDYPSGLAVNCLLVAKYFGVKQEHILVGNGASELIKALMEVCTGKIGIVVPTFEEYANRKEAEDIIIYSTKEHGFAYSAHDLMQYYSDKDIKTLLLINPDNPSGNTIPKDGVLQLAEWCQNKQIRLIVDESFVDFSENGVNDSLISEDSLMLFPDLVVVKSISKSFGVAGIRLGVLASRDTELIRKLKDDVSIWNINSFAEFYLQIWEKYQKEYLGALNKFRDERQRYVSELEKIPGLCIYPTQANYVMCEVLGGRSSTEITKVLLAKYNIFIKDLKGKRGIDGDYIRLAVRNTEDNNRLISALGDILS